MDDFYKLLNKYRIDGTFCDVALWAKCPTNPENVMGPYSAHKVVLAATCPSLASVMTSQVGHFDKDLKKFRIIKLRVIGFLRTYGFFPVPPSF